MMPYWCPIDALFLLNFAVLPRHPPDINRNRDRPEACSRRPPQTSTISNGPRATCGKPNIPLGKLRILLGKSIYLTLINGLFNTDS